MSQTTAVRFDEDVFLWCERVGMSAREIAERFGVSQRTVVRWRHQTQLSHTPAPEPHSAEEREHARRLIEGGCSLRDAGNTVGVSEVTIRRWFPDVPAWTKQQVGEYAALIRRMNRTLERNTA